MTKALIQVFAIFIVTATAQGQAPSLIHEVRDSKPSHSPAYSGSVEFSLQGKRIDDDVVNSAYGRGIVAFDLKASHEDWLKGRFKVGQYSSAGAASNLYSVTEGAAGSGTFVDEASVTVIPLKTAMFENRLMGGVLEVEQTPYLSALPANSWLAARIDMEGKSDAGRVALAAQQGVPSMGDVSNRVVDDDVLPLYTGASLAAELGSGPGLKVGAAASHFVFTDPSSAAANDSYKLGSTTTGAGSNMLFAYDFRGMEYAGEISYETLAGDKLRLAGSILNNELAPSGRGEMARLEYTYVANAWNIVTGATGFRLESDCLPATFTSSTYAFTNRIGASLSLKGEHRKGKFALAAAYTRAEVLDSNVPAAADGYQADRDLFTLLAEVKHDLF